MHTKTDYSPQIYDPRRRAIAVRYLRHEIRKLFPSLRDAAAWEAIDRDISDWYEGNPTLMPVRDFWNGLYGISTGFKLKNITVLLTSDHLSWEEKGLPADDLWFGSTLEEIKPVGVTPSAKEVRAWFFAPEQERALSRARVAHEERSAQTMPRDDFPMIVVRKEGVLRVVDGNRRLLRAILFGKATVNAVVGEPIGEPSVHDSWVPTSLLLELVSAHRVWFASGLEMKVSVARVIAAMIACSLSGRVEFFHRVLSKDIPADQELLAAVQQQVDLIP